VDHRTRICIAVITLGLVNFLAYVVLYTIIWGEAINGRVVEVDGQRHYYLSPTNPKHDFGEEVSRGVFIYSGVHSISIAPTVAAIMLAMLTLAKERIVSSMRRTIVRGRTLITIVATIITILVILWTAVFIHGFVSHLTHPHVGSATPAPAAEAL